MSVSSIESGTGGVWRARQAALGTITAYNAAGVKRLRLTGDSGFKPAKVTGSEESVDGLRFSNAAKFIDSIGGAVGDITYQAQPETAGHAFAQVIGVDVVTGTTPDYTHTMAVGTTNGQYQTYYQSGGSAVGPVKQSFWDALQNTFTWSCGQDSKVAHITEGVMALKAGDWVGTNPTATDSGSDPFNWNEVTTEVKINGTAFEEADGDTLEIDCKLDVHRGDSASPACFVFGKGSIMRSISAIVTDDTLPEILTNWYGTATPADADPITTAVTYVDLATKYTRTAARSLEIQTPNVESKADDFEIFPKAEGGKIPVTFGGEALKDGSTAQLTVIAKTADATSYVA
jgi:hypothetical protein